MSKLIPYKRRKPFKQGESPSTSPQSESEKSAWDYYNEKAKIEDIELVKDWYETLSNLLIFAALFSAILTAFVIESMKLLQEDTQESTRDILLFMTTQAVNASMPNTTVLPYSNDPFHLEGYVIAMNCMFFASLSLSLLAALASIIILQWVGKYDAGIMSFPTAKERALHRQFRIDGVRTWRMEDMIGALPYLLYFSLVFFFIGAIIWLRHLNTIVMAVVLAFFIIGILIYAVTTLLAVKFPSAPFRTPLSDYITGFLFTSPRHRETDAVKAGQSFELQTLLRYLGTLEIVPHSYNVLSKTVRLIMRQPFSLLSRPDGVVTETRWSMIFEIVLSAYQESREEHSKEIDNLMFQSLADYAISLSVQEAPEHQAQVKDLLTRFPISQEYNNILRSNIVGPINVEDYPLVPTSSGFLYILIQGLPTLSNRGADAHEALSWLSNTIETPSQKLDSIILLPNTLLKPLLTTAASAICRICHRENEMSDDVSSISDFVTVVTPSLEIEAESRYTAGIIRAFLHSLFGYLCCRLSRPSDYIIKTDILADISTFLNPEIHKQYHHIRLFDLLDAFSRCSPAFKMSGRSIISAACDINFREDNTISATLRRLLSLDSFLSDLLRGDLNQYDARKLLSSHFSDLSLFHPSKFSDAELKFAGDITDPALRLVAAFNSGDILGLDSMEFDFSEMDPLFTISASHWIALKLWSSDGKSISPEELNVLHRLLGVCYTTNTFGLSIGLASLVPEGDFDLRLLQLEPSDSFESFANFDAFVLSCQPASFHRLLLVLYYWHGWGGRSDLVEPHLVELMRKEAASKKIFSLVEQIWDPNLEHQPIFTPCFKGFLHSQDPLFLQSCCFLAIFMLETGVLRDYDVAKSLIKHLHLLADPATCSPVIERLSQSIARQEVIRLLHPSPPPDLFPIPSDGSHRASLFESSINLTGSVEEYVVDSITEWAYDLGSPRWIAFSYPSIWTRWLEGMKNILAE